MKFSRTKSYSGGALGQLSRAILQIQQSLERMRYSDPIYFKEENNSIAICSHESNAAGGDYAFKLSASVVMEGTPPVPVDPPLFAVKVLGGTAQTFGGTPKVYGTTTIPEAAEGEYVFLRYQNVDTDFVEIGAWDDDIRSGNLASLQAYTAPKDLVFVIGQISSDYAGNVRQDHKGGIIMPAISNVVDIQTKLPTV